MDPRVDAPDTDPDGPDGDAWTCDACGAQARYLTRDPWIDQDGRRLCGPCAAPPSEKGPCQKGKGIAPSPTYGDDEPDAWEPSSPEAAPDEPTLAGLCDVCGAHDEALYTVETVESAMRWGGKSEILQLCETCFERGEGR